MTACIRRSHAYWTTCPCPPCTVDRNRKAKLARTVGVKRVTAESAWVVVDGLLAAGWTGWAIASAADVPRRAIEMAITELRQTGRRRAFGPVISAALVNHGQPTHGSVGATGARRRLQGLAVQQWDLYVLADRSGIGMTTLAAIRKGHTARIRASRHAEIVALTDSIGMTVGPSESARLHAARCGWHGLLAWDDIDHDEHPQGVGVDTPLEAARRRQQETPNDVDPGTVERLMSGETVPATRAERLEVLRRWVADGGSQNALERMHGWNVQRDLRRAREHDNDGKAA